MHVLSFEHSKDACAKFKFECPPRATSQVVLQSQLRKRACVLNFAHAYLEESTHMRTRLTHLTDAGRQV